MESLHVSWAAESCPSRWAAMRLTKLGGVAGANFQTTPGALTPAPQPSPAHDSGHFQTSVYTLITSFIAFRRGLPPVGELARLWRGTIGEYFVKKCCAIGNKLTSTELRLTANHLNMSQQINYTFGGLQRHVRVDGQPCGSRSWAKRLTQISARGPQHSLMLPNHRPRLALDTSTQCVYT